jgi:hypothetical protein
MAAQEMLIERQSYGKKQTIGRLFCLDANKASVFDCHSLELPWLDNANSISCIPENKYKVKKRYSKRFGWHFHITDVKGRTWILIHKGNFYTQIRGCIVPGSDLKDINRDGLVDVTDSSRTMDKLLEIMPEEFDVTITKSAHA